MPWELALKTPKGSEGVWGESRVRQATLESRLGEEHEEGSKEDARGLS